MATALQWGRGERSGRKEAQVLKGKDIRLIICIKLDGVYMHFWSFCVVGEKPKRVVLGSDEYGRGFKLKKKKKKKILF